MLATLALVTLTACALYVCWQMIAPFLPAFTWALALAVAVHPLPSRLIVRLRRTPAALLTVFITMVVITIPTVLLIRELVDESTSGIAALRDSVDLSTWRQTAEANRFLQRLLSVCGQLDVEVADVGRELANRLGSWLTPAFAGSIWVFFPLCRWLVPS